LLYYGGGKGGEEGGIYPPLPTFRYMKIQKSISGIGPFFFEE